MKSRLRNAGQLFILTHNFLFFRQVKNWFGYLENKKETVGYYMLQIKRDEGSRCSCLSPLDPLLRDFESEYHYLFSLAYSAAQAGQDNPSLQHYYILPNALRRLLEAFLEFKVPAKRSNIYAGLEMIDFDEAKKTRIRRFCDTHSHGKTIGEPDQDPVILGEASAVARDLMELIKETDGGHYERMIGLLGQTPAIEIEP